jgi:hypothetical protein
MGLSGGPTGSRYVPPPPAETGAQDVAAAIAALVEDRLARDTEIRTAVQRTGCDGLPMINRLDGTKCAPIGGQMVLVSGNWLLTKNVSRPMAGAGGNIAYASETILGACDREAADIEALLRFGDNKGNVWDGRGRWLSKGNEPRGLGGIGAVTWYINHVEGGTNCYLQVDDHPILTVNEAGFSWNVNYPVGSHGGGGAVGANLESLCFGGPNSDLVLTCEVGNFDGESRGGSTSLCVRKRSTLELLGKTDMQYATSSFYWAYGPPSFAVSAIPDGSFYVHLYGGEAMEVGHPVPWPNWEYQTAPGAAPRAPGAQSPYIQRVTIDRATMKPTIVETRQVQAHAEMEPWDDDVFLIAFMADEGV